MTETKTNKVHYDLVDVHVAPLTLNSGVASYDTPVALPGSISMDLAPQGNIVKLRADGIVYYHSAANNGYDGSLNLAQVPDWFHTDYLGETLDNTAKVRVENAHAEPKPFALLFGFKGDVKGRRHVLYNCVANRPNIKGENKENQKEPDTESLPLSAVPLPNGNVKASTTEDTPDDVYKGWNTAVWQLTTTTE